MEAMLLSLCRRILERSPYETLSCDIFNEDAPPPRRGPGRHQSKDFSNKLDVKLSPAEVVQLALDQGLFGPLPPKPNPPGAWSYGHLSLDTYYQTEIGRGMQTSIDLFARRPYTGFDFNGPVRLIFEYKWLLPERAYSRRKRSQDYFKEADALTMRDWVELLTRSAGEGVRHAFGGFGYSPPHMCSAVFHADPLDFVRDFERIYQEHHEGYPMAVLLAREEGPYTPPPMSRLEPYFGSPLLNLNAPKWPEEAEIAAFVEGLQPGRLTRLRAQAASRGEAWLRDCLCAVGANRCHQIQGDGVLWAALPGAALYPLYRELYDLLGEELDPW